MALGTGGKLALTTATGLALLLVGGCDGRRSRPGEPLVVLDTIGEVGREPGRFDYPRAMDAGEGSLWVVDKTARVQRIDPQTGECLAWFRMPAFENGKPTGLTIGPFLDGSPALYVADTHEQRVAVFALPTGMGEPPEMLVSFGSFGTEPGQFVFPTDIAILTDDLGRPERIYVSEYGGNDRVSVFSPDALRGEGGFLFSFGVNGSGPGVEFNRPQALSINSDSTELVLTDAANHRLGRFTLDGELISWIGSADEAGTGAFDYPYGLMLLDGDRALVSEYGASRITLVDLSAGEVLSRYGVPGRGSGELSTPWALVAMEGTLFVLDSGNNRIIGCRPSGLSRSDLSEPDP